MIKYYKYSDEYGQLGIGTQYLEVEDGWCTRAIKISEANKIEASNICYPPWGLLLPEKEVDYIDDNDDIVEIDRDVFQKVWEINLSKREKIWNEIKNNYEIGSIVQGYVESFFPQGIVINLGSGILGVVKRKEFKVSNQPINFSTRQKATAKVCDYNEELQWLVLRAPQIHEENIELDQMNKWRQGLNW